MYSMVWAYLNLDVRLGDLVRTAVAAGNLLRLSELRADGLDAEVLEGEALDGVDAEDGVGVHDGEATGHYHTHTLAIVPFYPFPSPFPISTSAGAIASKAFFFGGIC